MYFIFMHSTINCISFHGFININECEFDENVALCKTEKINLRRQKNFKGKTLESGEFNNS